MGEYTRERWMEVKQLKANMFSTFVPFDQHKPHKNKVLTANDRRNRRLSTRASRRRAQKNA